MKKRKQNQKVEFATIPILNPNAAGIDIGDTLHAVAVPKDRDENPVREFGSMSCDLDDIVDWLEQCKIDTVAMESTGIYWQPLFKLLVQNGFEVYLVKPDHVKNVTGRKSDIGDAEWIRQLHSFGLLKSCYLPDDSQEELRNLVRSRRTFTQDSTRFVQRMEKAMEAMNIKVHTAISDITGKTGTAILEAIFRGEREAKNFLPFVDRRIKASEETIEKSLQGKWRSDQLFLLEQNYRCYQFFRGEIIRLDKEIELALQNYAAYQNDGEIPKVNELQPEEQGKKKSKRKAKNDPNIDTRTYVESILGTDVMAIYGIGAIGALEILAETGTDMSKWATAKHFSSWLNLVPNNKISGGKLLSSKLRKGSGAAGQAFRKAANGIQTSHNWLGDYFRRMRAKGGQKYAIVATAKKISAIYYEMVKNKKPFIPLEMSDYQRRLKEDKIAYMKRKIQVLSDELMKEAC